MKVVLSGGNTSNLHTHLQVHHKNEAAVLIRFVNKANN